MAGVAFLKHDGKFCNFFPEYAKFGEHKRSACLPHSKRIID